MLIVAWLKMICRVEMIGRSAQGYTMYDDIAWKSATIVWYTETFAEAIEVCNEWTNDFRYLEFRIFCTGNIR
jgi:aspartyl/asparaginyl beta-hydroxylase (cupin superfamily)